MLMQTTVFLLKQRREIKEESNPILTRIDSLHRNGHFIEKVFKLFIPSPEEANTTSI